MSDENATIPAPVQESLDSFDLATWLDDAQTPEDTVVIYRDGVRLRELKELTDFVQGVDEMRAINQKKDKRAEPTSIADEADDKADAAREQIVILREELAKTALTFHLKGMSPGEREILSKSIAGKLKKKAPTEDEDGHAGGVDHPDFQAKFTFDLVARSIVKIVNAHGAVDDKKKKASDIELMKSKLGAAEWVRLSNAVYDITYMAYDVDKLINSDFS